MAINDTSLFMTTTYAHNDGGGNSTTISKLTRVLYQLKSNPILKGFSLGLFYYSEVSSYLSRIKITPVALAYK